MNIAQIYCITTGPVSRNGEVSYDGTLRDAPVAPVIFVASAQEIKRPALIEECPGEKRQGVTFVVSSFYKVTLRHPTPQGHVSPAINSRLVGRMEYS